MAGAVRRHAHRNGRNEEKGGVAVAPERGAQDCASLKEGKRRDWEGLDGRGQRGEG